MPASMMIAPVGVEEIRDRQKQSDRCRRAQPRKNSDHDPERHACKAQQKVHRLQRDGKSESQVGNEVHVQTLRMARHGRAAPEALYSVYSGHVASQLCGAGCAPSRCAAPTCFRSGSPNASHPGRTQMDTIDVSDQHCGPCPLLPVRPRRRGYQPMPPPRGRPRARPRLRDCRPMPPPLGRSSTRSPNALLPSRSPLRLSKSRTDAGRSPSISGTGPTRRRYARWSHLRPARPPPTRWFSRRSRRPTGYEKVSRASSRSKPAGLWFTVRTIRARSDRTVSQSRSKRPRVRHRPPRHHARLPARARPDRKKRAAALPAASQREQSARARRRHRHRRAGDRGGEVAPAVLASDIDRAPVRTRATMHGSTAPARTSR